MKESAAVIEISQDKKESNGLERGWLQVGTSASGRPISVPYLIKRGSEEGPTLWVNAAVHGDEINGVFAAQRFFDSVHTSELHGNLIVTPVSNILAFDDRRKTSNIDSLDMDQSFPGRKDGFIAERIADVLFSKFAARADVVVNLHTLSTPFNAVPYVVYKLHPESKLPEEEMLGFIACLDPCVACRMPVANSGGELPGNIAGALDFQVSARGGLAFMLELGGGGRIEEDMIAHGVKGLRRLSAKLGMINAGIDAGPTSITRVTSRAHRFVNHGGLFEASTTAGSILKPGAILGTVRNLFGEVVETIVCDQESWVIAIRRDPVVHTGDRVAFLASKWDEVTLQE
jgi:predicted deacylase